MATAKNKQDDVSPKEHREKLHGIVKGAHTVVLLSHGEGGKIIGRPMAVARVEDDTTLYLVTGSDSKKVDEITRDPRVSLSIQNGDGYVMIDGLSYLYRMVKARVSGEEMEIKPTDQGKVDLKH